jgi:mono/diheme cytochrome c family protein
VRRVGRPLRAAGALGLLALLALPGCEGPDLGFPWDFERMLEQPRDEAYGASPLFEDGRAMRTPPAGTLPWRAPHPQAAPPDDTLPDELRPPPAVDRALLERGRDRFAVFCAPCHGARGHARTPVAEAMRLRPPPSLHEARVRALETSQLRRVVENGYGLMPGYGKLLSPREAWGVVLFVEALQLAEGAPLDSLPADVRQRAEAALRGQEPGR